MAGNTLDYELEIGRFPVLLNRRLKSIFNSKYILFSNGVNINNNKSMTNWCQDISYYNVTERQYKSTIVMTLYFYLIPTINTVWCWPSVGPGSFLCCHWSLLGGLRCVLCMAGCGWGAGWGGFVKFRFVLQSNGGTVKSFSQVGTLGMAWSWCSQHFNQKTMSVN